MRCTSLAMAAFCKASVAFAEPVSSPSSTPTTIELQALTSCDQRFAARSGLDGSASPVCGPTLRLQLSGAPAQRFFRVATIWDAAISISERQATASGYLFQRGLRGGAFTEQREAVAAMERHLQFAFNIGVPIQTNGVTLTPTAGLLAGTSTRRTTGSNHVLSVNGRGHVVQDDTFNFAYESHRWAVAPRLRIIAEGQVIGALTYKIGMGVAREFGRWKEPFTTITPALEILTEMVTTTIGASRTDAYGALIWRPAWAESGTVFSLGYKWERSHSLPSGDVRLGRVGQSQQHGPYISASMPFVF